MNIGKINPAILINRSLKKDEISEYKVAEFVEHYWNTLNPMVDFYAYKCKNQEELIKKALPGYILKCIENWLGHARTNKEFERLKKRSIENQKRAIKYDWDHVYESINEIRKIKQDLIDKGWTNKHANDQVKLHFGFREVPKWLKKSNKTIERNISKIFWEIESTFEVQKERTDPYHDCVDCGCPLHNRRRRALKSLHKEEIGTNKWLDEQDWKKYRNATLRSDKQKFEEKQAREKEWNTLEENQDVKKRSTEDQ